MKKNFFEDSFFTLPSITYIFSALSTCTQLGLLLILNRQVIPISPAFILADLLMPLADTLFALTVCSLPRLLWGKPVRKGSDYFLTSEE